MIGGIHRLRGMMRAWAIGLAILGAGCGEAHPTPSSLGSLSSSPLPTPIPSASPSPSPSPTSAATPGPTLPPEIYPSPLPLRPGVIVSGVQGCPNPQGLETIPLSKEEALAVLRAATSGDPETVRQAHDPSHWAQIDWARLATPATPALPAEARIPPERVTDPRPAGESPYGELIANMCGREVLARSWWVVVCAGPCAEALQAAPALNAHFFLIRRQGRWLIWWVYP